MKYSGFQIINKPQQLVVDLFIDPEYLDRYQEGFLEKVLIEGVERENGAVSEMHYLMGKREMLLTETIISNQLPDSFEAFYHHKHMDNTMSCKFIAIDENTTRYEYEFEYVRIAWIMPKLMMTFFSGAFKKQSEKWMNNFKNFVEEFE